MKKQEQTQTLKHSVIESYGLNLHYERFLENKCIWIVKLKDGTRIFQDDNRKGINEPSAWKRLQYYLDDHPDDAIVEMLLRFGSNRIKLPSNKPFYFYSKGFMQNMTSSIGIDYHIVGWPDDSGEIYYEWYQMPDLSKTRKGHRSISECRPEQLIGNVPETSVDD